MLDHPRIVSFTSLLQTASNDELLWFHGYLSAMIGSNSGSLVAIPPSDHTAPARKRSSKFTLAYGTETGNSKSLATTLAKSAKERGFQVKLVALDQYRLKDLTLESYFFLVVSTQGDGEPPVAAKPFFDLISREETDLSNLRYGIFALGDSSYPLFCQAGTDADNLLEKRGAVRVLSLVKSDRVHDKAGEQWLADVLGHLEGSKMPVIHSAQSPGATGGHRGIIATNINLNDFPSLKETHHIEIRCEGEIDYTPGDAAAFIPPNPDNLVREVLRLLSLSGEEPALFRGTTAPLREVLSRKVNLIQLPERVVAKYAALVSREIPASRMNFDALLRIYPPGKVKVGELLEAMEPITPRLYSISSSPQAHPGELHLTVARHTFPLDDGGTGDGHCSSYLNLLPEDSRVEFNIHRNPSFKLPAPDADMIMIGPGTGIAPFRSFLFERDATGATGKNWLFFGEQHFVTDFLYQTEMQDLLKTGVLSRLDLAFSRDQENKIYVQQRLIEHAEEVYQWIRNGAYVYVCGSRYPMSGDVEQALLRIFRDAGRLDETQAKDLLARLSSEGRYLKDVY